MSLKISYPAPYFEGFDQNGNIIKLTDFIGKKLVMYFYPKDNTPGCTAEACDITNNYRLFLSKGYEVIGISKDSQSSHKKFIAKYNIPFPLISDPDSVIIKLYDSYGLKRSMGREFFGTIRKTFIINENGIIEDIIDNVDTKSHSKQILKNNI